MWAMRFIRGRGAFDYTFAISMVLLIKKGVREIGLFRNMDSLTSKSLNNILFRLTHSVSL